MLNDDLNPQDDVDIDHPETPGGSPNDDGGGDSSPLDDLGLADPPGGSDTDNPESLTADRVQEIVSEAIAKIRVDFQSDLDLERQRNRSAAGRLRRYEPDGGPNGDTNLTDRERAELLSRTQFENSIRAELEFDRNVNTLVRETQISYEQAETIVGLQHSDDREDIKKGFLMENEVRDTLKKQRRDDIRKQQLADRGSTPEGSSGGSVNKPQLGHTPRAVAKAIIDKGINVRLKISEIAATYGVDDAEKVKDEHQKLLDSGYQAS